MKKKYTVNSNIKNEIERFIFIIAEQIKKYGMLEIEKDINNILFETKVKIATLNDFELDEIKLIKRRPKI